MLYYQALPQEAGDMRLFAYLIFSIGVSAMA